MKNLAQIITRVKRVDPLYIGAGIGSAAGAIYTLHKESHDQRRYLYNSRVEEFVGRSSIIMVDTMGGAALGAYAAIAPMSIPLCALVLWGLYSSEQARERARARPVAAAGFSVYLAELRQH